MSQFEHQDIIYFIVFLPVEENQVGASGNAPLTDSYTTGTYIIYYIRVTKSILLSKRWEESY